TSSITSNDSVTVNAAAASTLLVSGPSTATAGTSFNVTVTAKDAYGNTATGYRGTVRLTSSDTQATLPANYTFTATNAGIKTFSVTLRTAGSRSVTVTDTTTGSITGNDSVTVNAAAVSTLNVSAPTTSTAGNSFNVTATAKDAFGNTATGYRGTVRFTSNDTQATLPGNYTFTATDAGVHTFTVTLRTAGSRSVTTTDTTTGSITGNDSVTVSAAAASTLQVSAPTNATVGISFSVSVTAKDAFGNTATGYRGTVDLTSSDGQATLPTNYTFTATDAGTHSFNVILQTIGSQSVTVTDTATGSVTGTDTVSVSTTPVSPPPSPPPAPVPPPPVPVPAPVPAPSQLAVPPVVVNAPVGTQTIRVLNPGGSTRLALTPHPGFLGGIVAAAGDVNGDSTADVITAATFGGHVKVFNGLSGAETRSFYAFVGYVGPINLASGDLTGDGVADIIVAANRNGHVKVFDGITGVETISFLAYAGYSGPVGVVAADLTGDGKAELLTAADGGVGVHVKALSPQTLAERDSFYATGPIGRSGFSLSAGDVTGDGVAEFVVAAGPRVRVLDSFTRAVRGDFLAFDVSFPGRVTVQAAQYDGDSSAEIIPIAEVGVRPHAKVFDGPSLGLIDSFFTDSR
ncbi:MAG: VCBS repeat-containing protein, partial [Planctomycetia bacterium]|nr:VCBS repeat-containing protein [Planctomycetia bacterium]